MRAPPLPALAALGVLACASEEAPTPDTAELPCWERVGGSCGEPGDTGTAWLVWHGSIDVLDGELVATRGLAGKNLATGEYACDIAVQLQGTEPAETPCPSCDWSFAVDYVAGGTTGARCDAFSQAGTMFEAGSYTDFYFGRFIDGIGWAQVYPFGTPYGYSLYLESVVFAHLTSPAYEGWYIYDYNYPASGVYHVRGTQDSAEFERFMRSPSGIGYYYYFVY